MSTLTVPNTISNGDALDATPIEANFNAIETYVNTDLIERDGTTAMTGQLTLAGTPTADGHAARKKYVDDTVNARFPVSAANLASNAVTTPKIADANVTSPKLSLPWVSYTPSIASGTLGTGGVAGAYVRVKDMVFFQIQVDIGSTSSAMSNGFTASLPITPAVGGYYPQPAPSCCVWGATNYTVAARIASSAEVQVGDCSLLSNGDQVLISGWYEVS